MSVFPRSLSEESLARYNGICVNPNFIRRITKFYVRLGVCWLLGFAHRRCYYATQPLKRTRNRTNTNPNDTEANAAGSGNARALRKQSKCGVVHEGEGPSP